MLLVWLPQGAGYYSAATVHPQLCSCSGERPLPDRKLRIFGNRQPQAGRRFASQLRCVALAPSCCNSADRYPQDRAPLAGPPRGAPDRWLLPVAKVDRPRGRRVESGVQGPGRQRRGLRQPPRLCSRQQRVARQRLRAGRRQLRPGMRGIAVAGGATRRPGQQVQGAAAALGSALGPPGVRGAAGRTEAVPVDTRQRRQLDLRRQPRGAGRGRWRSGCPAYRASRRVKPCVGTEWRRAKRRRRSGAVAAAPASLQAEPSPQARQFGRAWPLSQASAGNKCATDPRRRQQHLPRFRSPALVGVAAL